MALDGLRHATRRARARLIYRLDTLLAYPPAVQVALLVLLTSLVVGVWAAAFRMAGGNAKIASGSDALWWSLAHFFDGGTMAGDQGVLRLPALGATVSGVLLVSLLTAAFASKMGERIHDLRSGLSPVVERGHLLVLGFDAKVALVARELARSRQACTLVILSEEEKARVEVALRPARQADGARMHLVVRTGDPRSEHALRRVAADRARAVIAVPPAALSDDAAVDWTFSALLAIRRAVEDTFVGQVIVEARHTEAESLLLLAAEPGVAGPSALATQVVVSDDRIARVLAQAARQEGVYFALRQLLAFNGCEIYLDPVPEALVGMTFDEACAAVEGAVLLGYRAGGEPPVLAPTPGASRPLARGDRMVVLAKAPGMYSLRGTLPPPPEVPPCGPVACALPQTFVLLGVNRTLPHLVRELDHLLPAGSTVRVVGTTHDEHLAHDLARAVAGVTRVTVDRDPREPSRLARDGDPAVFTASAAIILGRDRGGDDRGDANALATLLWLRGRMREHPGALRRVVTEVRDPRSAAHVAEKPHDFVVSHAVVAMLLAQQALDPDVAAVYREILDPVGVEIFIRPRRLYVPPGAATFGQVMAAARARGEVAFGFYPTPSAGVGDPSGRQDPDDVQDEAAGTNPLRLNPHRVSSLADYADAQIVVLAHP